MRSYVKIKHSLPKASVDFLSAKFKSVAKKEREDKSQGAIFREMAEVVRKDRGDLSPTYLAFIDFMNSAELGLNPASAGTTTEVSDVVEKASVGVAGVFQNEQVSSVRKKLRLPDVMNMELEDAIRTIFSSMGEVILKTVSLKMKQGPSPQEAGHIHWQENYFVDLLEKFPSLKEDLEKFDASLESMARVLFACGQKEVGRAEVVRSQRRGKLTTMIGVDARTLLQPQIDKERVLAGKPIDPEAAAFGTIAAANQTEFAPEDTAIGAAVDSLLEDVDAEGGDVHSRPTLHEINPGQEPAIFRQLTVTNEIAAKDPQKDLPTRQVAVSEVKAHLRSAMPTQLGMDASIVAAEVEAAKKRMAEAGPETQRSETDPEEKPESKPRGKRNSLLSKLTGGLLGGGDKDEE